MYTVYIPTTYTYIYERLWIDNLNYLHIKRQPITIYYNNLTVISNFSYLIVIFIS